MYIKNNNGPKEEPCGTPQLTFSVLEHGVLEYPEVQLFFTVKLATGEKVNLYYLWIEMSF